MENYSLNQQNFNYFYPYSYYYNYQNPLYNTFNYQNYGIPTDYLSTNADYSYLNNSTGIESSNYSTSVSTSSPISVSTSVISSSINESLQNSPKLSISSSKSNENSPINSPETKSEEDCKVKRETKSKRRSRTQFSKQQVDTLEAIFQKSHYPEVHVVDRLSDKLGLSIERISVWFQNRRAKFKKTKKPSSSETSSLSYDRNLVESIFDKNNLETSNNTNQVSSQSSYQNSNLTNVDRSWNSNIDWAY
ncbi:unnamed protein product [Brachionus calyciflorus]|uniref:Homeobox domain-containing protein n=1 Tax=Brachionus calyciflorus TaxID=104777 RepID=A0A814PTL3_9BILA|nr:unnamed protein product [Brachionus calyciflorus]